MSESIFNTLQVGLAFVLVLAPLVFIHELGHFLMPGVRHRRAGFSLAWAPPFRYSPLRHGLPRLRGPRRLRSPGGDESDEHRTGAPEEFLLAPQARAASPRLRGGAAFNVLARSGLLDVVRHLRQAGDAGALPGRRQVPPARRRGRRHEARRPFDRDRGPDVRDPERFMDAYLMEIMLSRRRKPIKSSATASG